MRERANWTFAMNDQKKPKIDLKARLGKKTVSSPSGPSIPPPMGGSRPGGIPAPPFSAPKSSVDPYSSMMSSAPPPPPKPQAIKVEMSEEVVREQKKQLKKGYMVAVVTAVIGGVVGFLIGGSNETSNQQKIAARDAGELAKEVTKASDTAEQLADVVKSIKDKLSSGKYPEEDAKKLGGLRIPFEGANLGLRIIGRFNREVNRGLLNFATLSEKANDATEHLQTMLGGSRKALDDAFSLKDKPKVHWSAVVGTGPSGPWATLMSLPEPFPAKSEDKDKAAAWPDSIKIKQGGKDTTMKRYTKGDPAGGDPLFIPVDPQTQNAVCPSLPVARVIRAVQDLEESLRGVKDPGGHEETGLIETGRAVSEKLKTIGQGH
jgi:hypothetical protein